MKVGLRWGSGSGEQGVPVEMALVIAAVLVDALSLHGVAPTALVITVGMMRRFDHDGQNRLEKVTNDRGETRWVGRDAAGNINVISDVGNVMSRYTYNKANQVTSAAWHGASCPLEGSANSNLPSGCVKFGYNAAGRLSLQAYPGNVQTVPTWDASGRMSGVKAARAGTSPQTMLEQTYGYTTAGADRVNVQTMVDKTGDFIPAGATTTYAYDSMNRLTSAVEKTTAGTVNASFVYAYDLNGNRTKQAITGPGAGANNNALAATRTFDHNRADELTIADGNTAGLGWDANGDETAAQGWLPGSVHGRSDVKTTSAGDVAQWTRTDTNQTFDFTNAQVLPTGTRNLTLAHDVTYTYNPVGLESYTSHNGLGTVKLFTLPTGQTLGYEVNGKMVYFHKDRLGSVLAMTNDAGGKEAFYRYDPYGQPRQYYRWSDEAKANTLMYVGLPRDFSTGLVRMGARWYDPTIARFTTADPSGQEQNPYLYAGGNPVMNLDPSGLSLMGDAVGFTMGAGLASATFAATRNVNASAAVLSFGQGFGSSLWGGASVKDSFWSGVRGAALGYAGSRLFGSLAGSATRGGTNAST